VPVPSGLAPYAWYFFSIFVGVIVGLVLEPLPGAAVAIIGITVVTVLGRFALFSPQQLSETGFHPASAALAWALSGYSNSTVWLIFGAFILALGYEKRRPDWATALLLSSSSAWVRTLRCWVTVLPWPISFWLHLYRHPRRVAEGLSIPSRTIWPLTTDPSQMTLHRAGSAPISCGSPS
jgi:hypothetical protein